MGKSFSKAFDMDKDVLFIFNSLAFFPLYLSVKKIAPTIHIQLLEVKSVKSTVCLSAQDFYVWC